MDAPADRDRAVLYISYTGLLEPLGHSQMWGYLERLARQNEIYLLTFEKPRDLKDTDRLDRTREKAQKAGIEWHPLRYHHQPTLPATGWDLTRGALIAGGTLASEDIDLIHARGHVAGALALLLHRTTGTPFVFDLRGFWAEAKVDAGHWTQDGLLHRTVTGLERQLIQNASGLVVLTEAARDIVESTPGIDQVPPTEVIPTCVDLDLFEPNDEAQSDSGEKPFTLGYVGSASGRYRFADALDCFELLLDRDSEAQLHVINRGDHASIFGAIDERGLDPDAVTVEERPHEEVPQAMRRMDAGVFFYPTSKASKATSPTKMAEFLACGLPCLTNEGVGDAPRILEANDVGVTLTSFDRESKRSAVNQLVDMAGDPGTTKRCRATAIELFSLDCGVEAYDRLYREATVDG